jgi:hypothetical protein
MKESVQLWKQRPLRSAKPTGIFEFQRSLPIDSPSGCCSANARRLL